MADALPSNRIPIIRDPEPSECGDSLSVDDFERLLPHIGFIEKHGSRLVFVLEPTACVYGQAGQHRLLDTSHMSLQDLLKTLDLLDKRKPTEITIGSRTSLGFHLCKDLEARLAHEIPAIPWKNILPWIDDACGDKLRPVRSPPGAGPPRFCFFTLTEDTVTLMEGNLEATKHQVESDEVTVKDILELFSPIDGGRAIPRNGSKERAIIRRNLLSKVEISDEVTPKRALFTRTVQWLERMYGVPCAERTFKIIEEKSEA
ncbi:hypothetical protein HKX48_003086 [Thoreauomyces humboldtii]|nr:hypothetical protein HKX48_003086 [Thoreauomyces humboldtii]